MELNLKKRMKTIKIVGKRPKSSGLDVPTTAAPVGMSGRYIEMERAGNLPEFLKLRKELAKLLQKRDKIDTELISCNERNALEKFAATMKKRGRKVESALRETILSLEEEKRKTDSRIDETRQRLVALDPSLSDQPITTLAAPLTAVPSVSITAPPKRGPNTRDYVSLRNSIIQKYPNLSAHEICKKLDAELHAYKDDLLEKWKKERGVSSFSQAYRDHPHCRNLIDKMISSARKDF
jgi:hypothetical protein